MPNDRRGRGLVLLACVLLVVACDPAVEAEQRAAEAEERAAAAEARADEAAARADEAEARADEAEGAAELAADDADASVAHARMRMEVAERRADAAESRLAELGRAPFGTGPVNAETFHDAIEITHLIALQALGGVALAWTGWAYGDNDHEEALRSIWWAEMVMIDIYAPLLDQAPADAEGLVVTVADHLELCLESLYHMADTAEAIADVDPDPAELMDAADGMTACLDSAGTIFDALEPEAA